ncbi:MAG: AEC family transporter [Faecalibacterium sp.]|nr:AEC family transporter [Faecalibacterium sp.]
MLSSIYFAFNAVTPIILLMVLGYMLRQRGFFDRSFLKQANKFAFRFGIGCMMFCNVYQLNGIQEMPWKLVLFSVGALLLFTFVGWLLAHFFTTDRRRKGPMMQSAFRSNMSIIGLPLAQAMAGQEGVVVASALQAPTIIYFNLVAVIVLTVYGEKGDKINFKKILKSIATNPLIIALVSGLMCLVIRAIMPLRADGEIIFSLQRDMEWLYSAINSVGKIGSPLSLIVLGGQFDFAAIKGARKELFAGVLGRLVLCPAIGYAAAFAAQAAGLFTLSPAYIANLIAMFGSPVAVSSAPMAAEMGADDQLASQLVVWSSLFSMLTIFVQITIFRQMGLL